MYKIGEFSKITNISIKTLRYYDKEGILIPEKRLDKNSYRYYDEKDYQKAIFVRYLRELSFSIAEIKAGMIFKGNPHKYVTEIIIPIGG